MALFSDAAVPKKASDVAAISEVLDHSRLSMGKGTKNHQRVSASVSIVYLLDCSVQALQARGADPALSKFDLCLDMKETHEDTLDRTISSYYLQDEDFLESQPLGGASISDQTLVSILEKATAIKPSFDAGGIKMLRAWLEAARQAMASTRCSSFSLYQQDVLERLCRSAAKLRLSHEIKVCDVVISINLYEESRVAKGLPSLLGFEVRSNGRQNVDLLDRDPVVALTKLQERIQSVCQSYGTHSDGSGDERMVGLEEEDDWS